MVDRQEQNQTSLQEVVDLSEGDSPLKKPTGFLKSDDGVDPEDPLGEIPEELRGQFWEFYDHYRTEEETDKLSMRAIVAQFLQSQQGLLNE